MVFYFDVYYKVENSKIMGRLSTFIIAHSILSAREELNARLKEYHKEFDLNVYSVKFRGCDTL